jgi:hypothetical protein
VIAVLALLSAACSSPGTPASPSPGDTSGGGNPSPPPSGPPTISINAGGLTPREVTIAVGGTVILANRDTRTHDLMGGLDPTRPECPEIALAGFLTPGQSREAGPFTTPQVCTFHSHAFPGIEAFQGRITVQ